MPEPSIVVALDLSEASRTAFDAGRRLAADLDAPLVLVHAFDAPISVSYYAGPAGIDHVASYNATAMQDAAHRLTTAWAESARQDGLTVTPIIRHGHPVETVLKEADAHHAWMIVAATHGHKGFRRLVLGSVCEALVRRSGRPVLVVPVQESGETQPVHR